MKKIIVMLLVVGLVATPGFAQHKKRHTKRRATVTTAQPQAKARTYKLEHEIKLAEFEEAYKEYKKLLALNKKAVAQEKELDALLKMAATYLHVWGIDSSGKGIADQRFGGHWKVHGQDVVAMDFLAEQAALLPEGQEQQEKYANVLELAKTRGREYNTLQEMYAKFLKDVKFDIQSYRDIQEYYKNKGKKKSSQTSDVQLEGRDK